MVGRHPHKLPHPDRRGRVVRSPSLAWRRPRAAVLASLSVLVASVVLMSCTPRATDAVEVDPTNPVKDTLLHDSLVQDTSRFGIPWNASVSMGSFVDHRDGWVYRTVQVGSLVWMAQNLEYRAPTPDGSGYGPDSVGRCPSDSRDSCSKYGRLYSWTEAMGLPPIYSNDTAGHMTRVVGICPTGWHLPSSAEWGILQQAAGGVSSGAVLKASAGWGSPGTDHLGMRFLPAGYVDGGMFHDRGITSLFWVMDEYDGVSAWNWYLYDGYSGLLRGLTGKAVGMSVRCVQD